MLNKAVRFITSFAAFIILLIPLFAIAEIDIYYLDVGQADAAVIICDGESLIIDGGNVDDSAKLCSFLTGTLRLTSINHIIASHPHEDHIGGLPAVFEALPVKKLYSPVLEYDSIYYAALIDAAAKQGIAPIIPSVGDSFPLGNAIVTFLSPAHAYEETNNLSLVVRISYGDNNFLFTGDAEWQAEDDLVASGFDLTSDVLKIGHHGSATSTTPYFLAAVYPSYAVISVAAENGYGHPVEDTMNMLKYYGVSVYRTDMEGDIYCHSDGHSITLLTEHDVEDEDLLYQPYIAPEIPPGTAYVGNANTMRLHFPDCPSVTEMKPKNRRFFSTRQEAIDLGYKPCGRCSP